MNEPRSLVLVETLFLSLLFDFQRAYQPIQVDEFLIEVFDYFCSYFGYLLDLLVLRDKLLSNKVFVWVLDNSDIVIVDDLQGVACVEHLQVRLLLAEVDNGGESQKPLQFGDALKRLNHF